MWGFYLSGVCTTLSLLHGGGHSMFNLLVRFRQSTVYFNSTKVLLFLTAFPSASIHVLGGVGGIL
ncbi:hypothetical protein HOY80DRAFT_968275 [Tuber brumale]|nr:hypothetical protein HOY80DRAFT_968275 [Tuber brumale]